MSLPMDGKRVLITGANSGIGFETAKTLALQGALVIFACRREDAAREAMAKITALKPDALLDFVSVDMANFASVRRAAEQVLGRYDYLDVLVNNAGIANMPFEMTEDGFEKTWQVNHLSPFLLTRLLLPALLAARGRVVTVASKIHHMGKVHWGNLNLKDSYFVMKAYAQSKLANILFARELSRRYRAQGLTSNALHPGDVSTQIWPERNWYEKLFTRLVRLFLVTPEQGARTSIYLASTAEAGNLHGQYLLDSKVKQPSQRARSDEDARRLWALSEQQVGLSE